MHAIRNLARIGFGTVSVRWSQLGFGRTSTTLDLPVDAAQPVRLQGRHRQRQGRGPEALDEHVWVGADDDAAWLAGGSYLVARRISMGIEIWDRLSLGEQEHGRAHQGRGRPAVGRHRALRTGLRDAGLRRPPVIPADSHVRVVHPDQNGGARMLRRGYNFVDGTDALGSLNAGLFFLAYVRDPRTDFIPVQRRMARSDTMMEYLKVTGSALFAVPPGIGPGEYVGQSLFA